ncbi:hypothetical protein O181_009592 [Austropuccinia psidii MF-1]|uniref:Uncharacterized protein n=1 Tax=Austropuccinia psidii MF-1 TaxID=1389203 RepID=A0A9Q3BS26_9BASI|nr:hypothetical protein [Austropuccinia psidii MF-1]
MVTSQHLQPVASSTRRREELSPLLFPATKEFKQRDCWPIQVPREDPNMESENQDAVARLCRRGNRILGRLLSMLMIGLFLVLPLRRWLQSLPGMKMN